MIRVPITIVEGHKVVAGQVEEGQRLTVGRAESVAVNPALAGEPGQRLHLCGSAMVSQQHVDLRINEEGDLVAKDRGSTNGTWLRMTAHREYPLARDFELLLGSSVSVRGSSAPWDTLREPTSPFATTEDFIASVKTRLRDRAVRVVLCTADEASSELAAPHKGVIALPLQDGRYVVVEWNPGTVNLTFERWLYRCVKRFNQDAIKQETSRATREDWEFTAASEGRVLARDLAQALAPTQCTLLLLGPTGCGKELLARDIHARSRRAGRPFVAANCGALTESLIESELFGCRAGAYTGAVHRDGLFQAAHGGTLFLDEIGDLPLSQQVKLLRALQERRVRRVGDTKEEPVDVRVIAATHRNLSSMIEKEAFREDLYYRLGDVVISIPAISAPDVIEMVPLMLERISRELQVELNESEPLQLAQLAALCLWPGNARELYAALKKYVLLRRSDLTTKENWAYCRRTGLLSSRPIPTDSAPPPAAHPAPPPASASNEPRRLKEAVEQIDNILFLNTARRVLCAGNRGDLARLGVALGMTGAGASARLHRLKIDTDPVVDLAALEEVLAKLYAELQPQLGWVNEVLRLAEQTGPRSGAASSAGPSASSSRPRSVGQGARRDQEA